MVAPIQQCYAYQSPVPSQITPQLRGLHAIDAGNDLVAESGCGISIPPENPQAMVDAVREMMGKTPAERASLGMMGRAYVLSHHAYEVLAARFEEAITECN